MRDPTAGNTLGEMSEWPFVLLELLFRGGHGAARKARLERFINSGVDLSSSFSGKNSVEVALLMITVAMRAMGMCVPSGWLTLWRGCDINSTSQSMAMTDGLPSFADASSSSSAPSTDSCFPRHLHYFPDVGSMLPDAVRNVVEANRPAANDTLEVKAECYGMQDTYLKESYKLLPGSTSRTGNNVHNELWDSNYCRAQLVHYL